MKVIPVISVLALATPAFAADAGVSPSCDNVFASMPDEVPDNPSEALAAVKKGVEFAKTKNWWGMSAVIIFVLMFILKAAGVFKKIGKRWAYIVVPVLSLAAMVLAKFAGDLSWGSAIAVLTSGPAMAALNDVVKRGVLGKEHSTSVKGT